MAVSEQSRAIRVFVSSTFRDMARERDLLCKFAFPAVRKLCEARGVTWGEIDLRWGITDEQSAEGAVLPVCLAEIDRCRPYFIGLLGERYGWIPEHNFSELLEAEPWLSAYATRSVTELEIVHGVLRDPSMYGRALFYFRDPRYLNRLPPDADRADFTSESSDAARRLGDLKKRIREAAARGVCRLRENYVDPDQASQWIQQDLTELVATLFPPEREPSALDREDADHEMFAESRRRVYVGRAAYFERLDAHVESDEPPLVVLGGSGGGKSALLANWVSRRRSQSGVPVFTHFVGASRDSADVSGMLRHIIADLQRAFSIGVEIPSDAIELRNAFANRLHMAASVSRYVLVIDGLNSLEDRYGAAELLWLPEEVSANARIVLSTLPGAALEELRRRTWPVLNILPLERDERFTLITSYLRQYTKTLDDTHTAQLAGASEAANPLYLRTLLEELRVVATHRDLDLVLNSYLQARSSAELFQKILARWERDYDADEHLVSRSMALIWAARSGLAESELLDLLGSQGAPFPRARWSPLYLAAESALLNRSGLLTFSHEYLREAVRLRYLGSGRRMESAHRRLADYFELRDLSPRQIDELPWQMLQAGDLERLARLFTYRREPQNWSRQFLSAAWDHSRFETQMYWTFIESQPQLAIVPMFREETEHPAAFADDDYLDALANLLKYRGHAPEARKLWDDLAERYAKAGKSQQLQYALAMGADEARSCGDLAAADRALERAEAICRELRDDNGLSRVLGERGLVQFELGHLQRAMELHRAQEAICRERNDLLGVGVSLHNQGMAAYQLEEYERALAIYREEEGLCRKNGDLEGLAESYGGEADVLVKQGRLADVMSLYHKQEDILRRLGSKRGLIVTLGNQAAFLRKLENYSGAMKRHVEEEALCREIQYPRGLAVSLHNQAMLLDAMGKPREAIGKNLEAQQIIRRIENAPLLQGCLANLSRLYMVVGEDAKALPLVLEREAIVRDIGPQLQLGELLGIKARLLRRLGYSLHEVREALDEQERLVMGFGSPEQLMGCKLNRAAYLPEPERSEAIEAARRIAREHRIASFESDLSEVLEYLKKSEVSP